MLFFFFLKGQMCMGSTEIEFNNNKKMSCLKSSALVWGLLRRTFIIFHD